MNVILRLIILSIAVLLIPAGCAKRPPQGVVSGSVSLDGAPVKTGVIRFVPIDGKTTTAGGEIKEGKYMVTAPVNKFKVTINAAEPSQQGAPINDDAPLARELIPAKYNARTELVLDIQAGQNQRDFQLNSR
jgi:hypothetical protein